VAPPAPLRPAHALAGASLLEVAEQIRQLGSGVAAITDGERGCWCATPNGPLHIPAFAVDVVDTTGAGDVFHGAFLVGITRGWDLARSLTFAAAVAALKCRVLGGRAGIPTMEEALALVDHRR
jgi:sugar/nucleoside kinase (ribokinase family)